MISIISPARLRSIFICACVFLSTDILAQSGPVKDPPPTAYQLIAIKVTGSQRYTPAELAVATGLQIGQTVHEEDFRAVVKVLGESGAFSDVGFGFDYSAKGTKGEFHVKDAPDFVPAHFENFVWFSNHRLLEDLHSRIPLFRGELPVHGDLVEQVSVALQAMLVAEKVEGSADYIRAGTETGRTEAFDFRVTGRSITVGEVKFEGVDSELLALLNTAARKLNGEEYFAGTISAAAQKSFLPFYLQRGYLKASIGDPEARVVKNDLEVTVVDVTFRPKPGPQYKLGDLMISGNKIIPTDALRRLIPLRGGDPVNGMEMEQDVAALQHMYGTRGYMAAEVKVSREVDDRTLAVKYELAITEGEIYTMGDLDIHGVDSRTRALVQAAWTLNGGDTYNADYPAEFVKKMDKQLRDWNITVHESVNPQDKTVDVSLRFDSRN